MNFVRTQNYSGDKASGGLIDFAKGSLLSTDRDAPTSRSSTREAKDRAEGQFKPKELFSDRDLEYAAENLTSATAIASAFSEEDIAHLDQLEKRRNELWKRRRLEEEEFVKEAQRLRNALPDEDAREAKRQNSGSTSGEAPEVSISLFAKSNERYKSSQRIIGPEIRIVPRSTVTCVDQSCEGASEKAKSSRKETESVSVDRGNAIDKGVSQNEGVQLEESVVSGLALVQGYTSEED
ncbi:uncharacterized protein BcabD6B2_35220 [Babesia caballi]|uniref:FAM192A/Fyv6 N-terminal domain-containing protein n=1 Tax=Babesia caballi TaxID=5871 RepID=A0AAV4LV22_BABCB|nr:hypothetical protein, conserved [Babesia caballi]